MADIRAPEGLSLCQLDAYKRRLETTVLCCEPCGDGYQIELDATILYFFPEDGPDRKDSSR